MTERSSAVDAPHGSLVPNLVVRSGNLRKVKAVVSGDATTCVLDTYSGSAGLDVVVTALLLAA